MRAHAVEIQRSERGAYARRLAPQAEKTSRRVRENVDVYLIARHPQLLQSAFDSFVYAIALRFDIIHCKEPLALNERYLPGRPTVYCCAMVSMLFTSQ